jgi:hypothetical protein
MCLHFVIVVGLEWSEDPKSYAGCSLLLVGSPLPDRSNVMTQTKRGTLVLQVVGWGGKLMTYPYEKCLLRKHKESASEEIKTLNRDDPGSV